MVLDNVIKSPRGKQRSACPSTVSGNHVSPYNLISVYVSLHMYNNCFFLSFTPSHSRLFYKSVSPSVTLSVTADHPLSSCRLISLTCTLIFPLPPPPLLMCQQTQTRRDAVKSAVIQREREREGRG